MFEGPQRLHKVLAQCGFGSLRGLEEQIIAGRITVNRLPAEVGQKIGPEDQIRINGELVRLRFAPPRARVLIYHKPAGEIVTRSDPEGRPTVFDKLPRVGGSKWIAIGRLDFNSEGLLLFTTSGELANRLMHPRYEIEREYAVRIMGTLTQEQEKQLREGIKLEDGEAKVLSLSDGGGEGANHWYTVVLAEGRNREVRRLFEALGLMVSRLIRTRYGIVNMPSQLKRGDVLELDPAQLIQLLSAAGMMDPDPDDVLPDNIGNRAPEGALHDPDDESRDVDGNRALPAATAPAGNVRGPNAAANFNPQDGRSRERGQGRSANGSGYREKNGNVAGPHSAQAGKKYPHPRSDLQADGNRAPGGDASQRRAEGRPFASQPRGNRNGNAQANNGQARGGLPRGGQSRNGQPRDGQPRDGQPRDGQPRDGQPRDGQPRDGQPRDGQPRDGQPRDGQPRDGQPRDSQARVGQQRDGQPGEIQQRRGEPRDGQPRDGQPRNGNPRGKGRGGHGRGPQTQGQARNSQQIRGGIVADGGEVGNQVGSHQATDGQTPGVHPVNGQQPRGGQARGQGRGGPSRGPKSGGGQTHGRKPRDANRHATANGNHANGSQVNGGPAQPDAAPTSHSGTDHGHGAGSRGTSESNDSE